MTVKASRMDRLQNHLNHWNLLDKMIETLHKPQYKFPDLVTKTFSNDLIDLDNYLEFKSVSRAGFKFSPDKLLPRCEIVKMRPKLLAEKQRELAQIKREQEQ